VLRDEGYITDFTVAQTAPGKAELTITLKYSEGRPVIDRIERVSKPGRRVFRGKDDLPKVMGGLGVAIVSTPKGLMSDRAARAAGHGGEVLCVVA
jgi:small subunit ribosomal protein S8